MDSTSIELPGCKVAGVDIDGERVRVVLEPAYLVKMMTGSVERTRWWQNGAIVFDGAELEKGGLMPEWPAVCVGGDVGENVYTYRDMVPVPLESRGRAHCVLRFADGELRVHGDGIRLVLDGVPRYIEHIRPADMS